MEKNNFLELIQDTENRVFPLHYKDVKIKSLKGKDKLKRETIAVAIYQTAEYNTYLFHKPISKML